LEEYIREAVKNPPSPGKKSFKMHLNKIKKELGLTDTQFNALNEVIKQLVFE
jgi:hypothetical protein